MTDTSGAQTLQESVDCAERSLVFWINRAWAGLVPGDARDYRRVAGNAFDRLRADLDLQPMGAAPDDCAQDELEFYARLDVHPLRTAISRILVDDPELRQPDLEAIGPTVERLCLLFDERSDPDRKPTPAPVPGHISRRIRDILDRDGLARRSPRRMHEQNTVDSIAHLVQTLKDETVPPAEADADVERRYGLAESWDGLRAAISRMLTSGAETMTAAAERLKRATDAMDTEVKRTVSNRGDTRR